MPWYTYLWGDLINSKVELRLFQILQKKRLFLIFYNNQVLLGIPLYVRDNLEDNSMLFTHFYVMQEKNLVCISNKPIIF